MALSKEKKQEVINSFKISSNDTGSVEVQVVVPEERQQVGVVVGHALQRRADPVRRRSARGPQWTPGAPALVEPTGRLPVTSGR